MGAWLAPVSRVLTHASASLQRLDREAGIITLLLDESPSLGLMMAIDGTREGLRVSVLVSMRKSLQSCEMLTCFGSCKPHVTEPHQIEHICLLELEAGDLVSQLDCCLVEVVVVFDVGAKAPIVEEGGFDDEGGKCGGLRAQELNEPVGEHVGISLDGDDGVGKEWVEEEFLAVSSKRPGCVLGPVKIFDEGGLYRLAIDSTDDEVGKAAIVGLEAFGAFSELDEGCECGGVVACSYVGKLLLERGHLLSPHLESKGLLHSDSIEGGLPLI